MKYPDILEACLERLRSGALVDDVVAEYPRFADELRRDLAAAASARSVPAGLPPAGEGARARFQVELQSRRGAAAARLSKPGGGWLRWSAAMPAIAASAAVLLLAVVLLGGVFSSSQTAEAAVEGVVVDNDGTTLTLQTETGLQTISLADQATVSSDSGSALQLSSIEPGQLVLIRGARATKAAVVARRIQLRAAADVRTWCDRFPGQCAELEGGTSCTS